MVGNADDVSGKGFFCQFPVLCEEDEIEVPVQINGKVRTRITLPKDASQDQALAAAREALATQLADKPLRKTIWVPNKILNLIL